VFASKKTRNLFCVGKVDLYGKLQIISFGDVSLMV